MSKQLIACIWVAGLPKGQPRVRACIRGKHAGVYTPDTANDWKALVMADARQVSRHMTAITGPVFCDVSFLFPRPKYLWKKTSPQGRIPHTKKPDRDNLDKTVLDALTQVGLWADDCQVCGGSITKAYVAIGEPCGAQIDVYVIGSDDQD